MQHRGTEYTVVQGIQRGVWKWSASVAGVVLMGKEENRSAAVAAAEKAIDRALAQKGRPDGSKSSEPIMFQPAPELPDDTPLDRVELPPRIRNALTAAGLKTVGEVRETPDQVLFGFQDLGKGSVAHLRETLGLPSCEGVRPVKG